MRLVSGDHNTASLPNDKHGRPDLFIFNSSFRKLTNGNADGRARGFGEKWMTTVFFGVAKMFRAEHWERAEGRGEREAINRAAGR
jgi:hypothetical protein